MPGAESFGWSDAEQGGAMEPVAERLETALRQTPGVDAWQVATTRRAEAQVYLIGADPEEARRVVTSDDATVTLHNLHAPHGSSVDGKALGETTLTLLPDELADPSRLAAQLRAGALLASLTDNPPYTLPGMPAGGFPSAPMVDSALGAASDPLDAPETLDALQAAVARVGEQIRAALRQAPGVRLGSAEIFASRAARTLTNSQGLRASTRETSAFLDLVLLAGEGERAVEFHAELRRRRLSDLHIERIIAAYSAFTLHRLRATAPGAWRGPVLLSGEAAAQLFNPLFAGPIAAHTSAELAYRRMSRLKMGNHFTPQEPRGDRLTLVSDASRPYGVNTAPYDGAGVPAHRATLIADGVFRRPWSDARYAQYLGMAATGALSNLTVARGATPLEQLRRATQREVYEIVAFSLFNPDPVTGDFSAEIRLGYRHDAAGVTPIKGGSLVGNIFDAFGDARFSAESFCDGVYYGPAGIRFGELTITAG